MLHVMNSSHYTRSISEYRKNGWCVWSPESRLLLARKWNVLMSWPGVNQAFSVDTAGPLVLDECHPGWQTLTGTIREPSVSTRSPQSRSHCPSEWRWALLLWWRRKTAFLLSCCQTQRAKGMSPRTHIAKYRDGRLRETLNRSTMFYFPWMKFFYIFKVS